MDRIAMRSIQTLSNRMQSRKKLASGSLVLRLGEPRATLEKPPSDRRKVPAAEASGDTMTRCQRPANPLENRMSLTAALPFVS
jgi:hypothetical protein